MNERHEVDEGSTDRGSVFATVTRTVLATVTRAGSLTQCVCLTRCFAHLSSQVGQRCKHFVDGLGCFFKIPERVLREQPCDMHAFRCFG